LLQIVTIFHSYYLSPVIGNINFINAFYILTKEGGKLKTIKRAGHVASTREIVYQYTILVENVVESRPLDKFAPFGGRQ
jgi:hypothetical protein